MSTRTTQLSKKPGRRQAALATNAAGGNDRRQAGRARLPGPADGSPQSAVCEEWRIMHRADDGREGWSEGEWGEALTTPRGGVLRVFRRRKLSAVHRRMARATHVSDDREINGINAKRNFLFRRDAAHNNVKAHQQSATRM